jgi:hypothetical protein
MKKSLCATEKGICFTREAENLSAVGNPTFFALHGFVPLMIHPRL